MAQNKSKLVVNVGRRIAEIRIGLGLTQDKLADLAGVTVGYVRQVEGGTQNLTLETIERFCALLKCEPISLFLPPNSAPKKPGRPPRKN